MNSDIKQVEEQVSQLSQQVGKVLDANIYHRDLPIALSGQIITQALVRNLSKLDVEKLRFSKASVVEANGDPDILSLVEKQIRGNEFSLAIEAGIALDMSDEARGIATKKVEQFFESSRYLSRVDLDSASELAGNLVAQAINLNSTAFKLEDLRDYDQYTYYHSVNCCVLATALFSEFSDSDSEIKELGMGMLLHDIGKSKIELRILQKPDRLTNAEFSEIQRHTTYGYNLVKTNSNVSEMIRGIIRNHHEHVSGSGYMRGLHESELSIFDMIACICDSFDAMTTSRPYRDRIDIHKAVAIMIRGSGIQYNTQLVNFFLRAIGRFPVGTFVLLSNSEIGVVQRLQSDGVALPVIKIVFDAHGSKLSAAREIDLSHSTDVYIEKAIELA